MRPFPRLCWEIRRRTATEQPLADAMAFLGALPLAYAQDHGPELANLKVCKKLRLVGVLHGYYHE